MSAASGTKPVFAQSYHVTAQHFCLLRPNGYLDCQCTGPLSVYGNKGKPSAGFESAPAAAHYGTFKF